MEIIWTPEAQRCMSAIYAYLVEAGAAHAFRTIEDIYRKADLLTRFPELGYQHLSFKERRIRVLLCGHYRIAYVIKHEDALDIIGVYHGKMDMERRLREFL